METGTRVGGSWMLGEGAIRADCSVLVFTVFVPVWAHLYIHTPQLLHTPEKMLNKCSSTTILLMRNHARKFPNNNVTCGRIFYLAQVGRPRERQKLTCPMAVTGWLGCPD